MLSAFRALPPLPADRRGMALIAVAALIGFVLWRIPLMTRDANYWPVFLAWLAAILLFLAAVGQPGEGGEARTRLHAREWLRARRGLLLAVGALGALALVLRVWRLGDIPFTLSGDEASQGLDALKFSAILCCRSTLTMPGAFSRRTSADRPSRVQAPQ